MTYKKAKSESYQRILSNILFKIEEVRVRKRRET